MVFHWSLSDSKSPQVSRTLLSILAVLNNAVVWIVSTRPPTSKSSSPFSNPLVTVPEAPITIGIIVTCMFHSFFNSLARSRYLSFFSHSFSFILWSAENYYYYYYYYYYFTRNHIIAGKLLVFDRNTGTLEPALDFGSERGSEKGQWQTCGRKALGFGWATSGWASCIIDSFWQTSVLQAHIALSEPMSNVDQQGSRLGSFPNFPSPYPHFNRPSGYWPCVEPCLVRDIGK